MAGLLKLEQGEPVIEIVRVRLADDEPILLETSYLSQKRFPGLEHASELSFSSLYEWLGMHYQTNVTMMDQTLEPVLLKEDQAKYLESQPGTPAMLSKVRSYSNGPEPIEYSWSVTRGDQCRFYFSFRRGEECS